MVQWFVRSGRARVAGCVAALSASIALAGCSSMNIPKTAAPTKKESINFGQTLASITLNTEMDDFVQKDYDRGAALPRTLVGPVDTQSGLSALSVLELLLVPNGIGVLPSDDVVDRQVRLVDPGRRPLNETIARVCDTAALFCRYHDGILEVSGTRDFHVRVARIGESLKTVQAAADKLGAKSSFIDEITGQVSFNADYHSYRSIRDFMANFSKGRDVLVYDTWLVEVTEDKTRQAGFFWDQISALAKTDPVQFSSSFPSQVATTAQGLTFSSATNIAGFTFNTLASLVDHDDNARTLTRPTLSFLSGQKAELKVVEKRTYIRSVTSNVGTNFVGGSTTGTTTGTTTGSGGGTTGSTSNNGSAGNTGSTVVNNNGVLGETVEPADLETGLDLKISGSHDNGIIHSDIDLSLSDLIAFDTFSTGTTTLKEPHTADRNETAAIDVRPGDLIVIGGLLTEQVKNANDRVLATNVPLNDNRDLQRVELVIMMRPRLIKIRPVGVEAATPGYELKSPEVALRDLKATPRDLVVVDPKAEHKKADAASGSDDTRDGESK